MNLWFLATSFAAAAIAQAAPPPLPPPSVVSASTIIAAVIDRNRDLHSYQVAVTTNFKERGFPFLRINLNGTASFQSPDRYAISYEKLPVYMKGFPEAYGQMLNVPAWPERFVITSDAPRTVAKHTDFALHLAPRDPNSGLLGGEVMIDPATWTVEESVWQMSGNVSFSIAQKFETIGSYCVLASQQFAVQVPHIHADGNSTFKDYRMNVAIADEVFAPH
jgi:hypothetical protein